jgi:hypothetical protein
MDEIGAGPSHSFSKALRCLAQETGISKTSALSATKLLKLKVKCGGSRMCAKQRAFPESNMTWMFNLKCILAIGLSNMA